MATVVTGRYAAQAEGSFVVFLIGRSRMSDGR